jgi:hypothetical protein
MIRDLKGCSYMSMETNHPPVHGAHGPGAGYEQRDANIPDLLKFGVWMALVIFVTLVSMKWTFNYFERTQTTKAPATPFERTRELPPSPRLQTAPHQELQDYCQEQMSELNSYGWVDQRQRVVHIPIDQAMDLVLKNGLPIRDTPPTGAAAVNVPPPMVTGGADLEGPCVYLAPPKSDEPAEGSPER